MTPTIRLDAAALATTSPILPHQQAAWNWLQEQLTEPEVAEFAELFRADPAPKESLIPKTTNPLTGVPYYRQRDSAQLSQRDRTCFSSSCAMLLEALKPGTLHGPNGDDQYLATVQRFGDTTEADAQIQALAYYGITAQFEQTADFLTIERQIACGIPVPCGYLHRGPVHRPTGGGHWAIVIGHTRNSVIVNDPWGDPDLITGTTISPNGKGLHFSRGNFGRRWMVRSIGNGAYRFEPGQGWAIIADRA